MRRALNTRKYVRELISPGASGSPIELTNSQRGYASRTRGIASDLLLSFAGEPEAHR